MMKRANRKRLFPVVLAFGIFMTAPQLSPATAEAQWSRAGKADVFAFFRHSGGDDVRAPVVGTLEVSDFNVFGAGAGYNINSHFNVNANLHYGGADLKGRVISSTITADSDVVGGDFNVDFNALKTRFTPMFSGGIGFLNFHGDVNGVDFNETNFSYNLGGGLRWDFTDKLMLKALYRLTWTELEDTRETLLLDAVEVKVGLMF